MITKIKGGLLNPKRGYFAPDYYEDSRSSDMISERQRRQLTEYILRQHNDSEDEKQDRIDALSELTQEEADDYLLETSCYF
jgi:hypothetical protein